jgi:DeoR/GlpR family transcriptional regulator of sugar metabolism
MERRVAPEVQEQPILSEERRSMVADMLQANGVVTIGQVQSRFGVSPMTARRDLTVLANRGVARRTHGGAVLPSIGAPEHSFTQRLRAAPEAKERLAEAAFALLSPRETVFLDASSTTYFLARLIVQRELRLRVVTNSLPVLCALSGSDHSEIEPVAIGGTFRRLTCSYVGPAAVRAVGDLFADWCFLSVTGVTGGGVLTDADVLEAEVKRTMLKQSEQSALLVDDSKLAANGRYAVGAIAEVSLVLADGLDADDVARLSAQGACLRESDGSQPTERSGRGSAAELEE